MTSKLMNNIYKPNTLLYAYNKNIRSSDEMLRLELPYTVSLLRQDNL